MDTKFKFKFITIITIIILLLNSTSLFAFSLFKKNSNLELTEKQIEINTNKEIEKFEKTFSLLQKTYERQQKSKAKISSFAQKIKNFFTGKSTEVVETPTVEFNRETVKFFFEKILGKYVSATDDPEVLADVFSNLTTDIDWSFETIGTLIKQLIKALYNTSSGIPSSKDFEALIADMTSGEFYHLDLDKNGNEVSPDTIMKYTNMQDIGRFCNYASMKPALEGKPISIGKIDLTRKNPKTNKMETLNDVYLVALAGTNFAEGQSNGLIADILSGTESNSPYLQNALEAILETIPKGSKIMFAGFSLGGMMSQQLMVQSAILENYDIIQVTIVGSPALCVEERIEALKNIMLISL